MPFCVYKRLDFVELLNFETMKRSVVLSLAEFHDIFFNCISEKKENRSLSIRRLFSAGNIIDIINLVCENMNVSSRKHKPPSKKTHSVYTRACAKHNFVSDDLMISIADDE